MNRDSGSYQLHHNYNKVFSAVRHLAVNKSHSEEGSSSCQIVNKSVNKACNLMNSCSLFATTKIFTVFQFSLGWTRPLSILYNILHSYYNSYYIILIIIPMPTFMVLWSWQCHCESSPSSRDNRSTAPGGCRPLDQAHQPQQIDPPTGSYSDYIDHSHLLLLLS